MSRISNVCFNWFVVLLSPIWILPKIFYSTFTNGDFLDIFITGEDRLEFTKED